jgi:hypothetical protein
MQFIYSDGGRDAAGYKGATGDCCVRAFAIASGRPYQEVYDLVNDLATKERPGSKRRKGRRSNARTGVFRATAKRLAYELGPKWLGDGRALWTPTMGIGTGCTVHLRDGELPMGRLVVSLSKHYAAVIDGVLFDTYDCSRDGDRCVYGYWTLG